MHEEKTNSQSDGRDADSLFGRDSGFSYNYRRLERVGPVSVLGGWRGAIALRGGTASLPGATQVGILAMDGEEMGPDKLMPASSSIGE
jgi:hypothetical protein